MEAMVREQDDISGVRSFGSLIKGLNDLEFNTASTCVETLKFFK